MLLLSEYSNYYYISQNTAVISLTNSGSATESSSSSNVTGVNPFPVTTTTTTDTTPAATQPTGGLLKSDVHKMANPLDWNNIPDFIKKRFPHWKNSATATTTTTTSQPILGTRT